LKNIFATFFLPTRKFHHLLARGYKMLNNVPDKQQK